jgi:hypothetical protein
MSLYYPQPTSILDEVVPEHDVCVIPRSLWSQWIADQIEDVLLVRVIAGELSWTLYVHSHHDFGNELICLPQWCYDQLANKHTDVEVERLEEMPPHATKIVLEPLEEEMRSVDLATAVSEYLSNRHTITQGMIIPVPIAEIDGYVAHILVKATEPAETVLLRGEVPLELSEIPQEQGRPQHNAPLLSAPLPSQEESFFDAPMFASPIAPPQKGFVPFGGQGHRLS